MKRNVIVVLGMSLLFMTSSGSTDYSPAAESMCKCMEEKNAEEKGEYDLGPEVDYNFCALDVTIEHSIDVTDAGFGTALEEKCADLKDLHADYLKTSAE